MTRLDRIQCWSPVEHCEAIGHGPGLDGPPYFHDGRSQMRCKHSLIVHLQETLRNRLWAIVQAVIFASEDIRRITSEVT
jgi:hypothetical protein